MPTIDRPPWIPKDLPWPRPREAWDLPAPEPNGNYQRPLRFLPPVLKRDAPLKPAAGQDGISGASAPESGSSGLERAEAADSGFTVEVRCAYECGVEDGYGHSAACRRVYSTPEGGQYSVPADAEIPDALLGMIAEILRPSRGGDTAPADIRFAGYNARIAEENRAAFEAASWPGSIATYLRPTWDEWALALAGAVATRADCTRRQVGAVILDSEHRVVSTGYNGYPSGRPGCATAGACPRGRKSVAEVAPDAPYVGGDAGQCDALHAEENAVLWARRDLRGCTLYCTHQPCPNCARFLAGTGIARVVWPGGERSL